MSVGELDGMIRVLLIDDHRMFAESVARILSTEHDIDVVGVATTVAEAVRLVGSKQPDVAIVDYQLPDGDGVEAARKIRSINHDLHVVMLTGMGQEPVLVAAIEAGCTGFLTKDRALDELVQAVRLSHAGDVYITPAMLGALLPRLNLRRPGIGSDLTKRELEVLNLVAEGLSNQAIGERLTISVHTVRNHIQNVLIKLQAHSKLEAVVIATREHLLRRRR